MNIVEFYLKFPLATSVVLEFWDFNHILACIPMESYSEGNWKVDVEIDEGLHHYCFLINNSFRINDPETAPIYVISDNRLISTLKVEEGMSEKLTQLEAQFEIGEINMYSSVSKGIVKHTNQLEFSPTDNRIYVDITFGLIRSAQVLNFLWINPLGQIVYSSDCTVWEKTLDSKQPLKATGWLDIGFERQLMSGRWQFVLIVNGMEVHRLPFYIRNNYYQFFQGRIIAK